MSPELFLHQLHADTGEARPPDWEVDWADAPLPYKLYRGLPAIPLASEVPLSLPLRAREPPADPDLSEIGHFLWYAYGLAQVNQSGMAANPYDPAEGPAQMVRRFVPSGGGLYPSEVYVYLKIREAPEGVYHYDAAHHRLVLLREGNFDSYLTRALGGRCDMPACFGAVFVSTMFWKNFFKYHNFSYRLQGLDAGVLIGQLLEVADRFGYQTGVIFQFLDRPVGHLLGLSDREESVYAVMPLAVKPSAAWFGSGRDTGRRVSAAEQCRELPAVRHGQYVRSRRIKEYPMLIRLNEASMLDSPESFRQAGAAKRLDSGVRAVYFPDESRLSYDLASSCRKRYSPETEFVLGKVTHSQAAALLHEAASFSYLNDIDKSHEEKETRVSLYGCFYNVEGVPDGAYRYDCRTHALRRIQPGDHRHRLQQGMTLGNVNLFQVPLCLHIIGDKHHHLPDLGYRGYRIQQMEAGMLVQRLLLGASALGMGGRPLLGFQAGNSDELYKLAPQGQTSLIQIPIGPCRERPRLEGSLRG